ncbi:MAG: heavy-metal-associated domain-containing protein [Dehalococcoidia bacterium]|jgi:copper chaperone CopZ|nr:heavy-metal-associated domain-containing protein [Dehalococcoidia bacterium]
MEEVTLVSPDISCDHCIQAIRKALTALPGVEWVGGDPDAKQVTIRYDPSLSSLADIRRAMEEEGYPVAG